MNWSHETIPTFPSYEIILGPGTPEETALVRVMVGARIHPFIDSTGSLRVRFMLAEQTAARNTANTLVAQAARLMEENRRLRRELKRRRGRG